MVTVRGSSRTVLTTCTLVVRQVEVVRRPKIVLTLAMALEFSASVGFVLEQVEYISWDVVVQTTATTVMKGQVIRL